METWEVGLGPHKAVIYSDDGTIASVTDEMVDWQANARLIAAAPELLDMLKDVLNDYLDFNHPCELSSITINKVKALISEAAS
ncbi:hypothetical protein LCGC14_0467440 [marine sediment metagenome]|uniref:Uncharacterized protein n=1 Tax=marine sediment metagenome TaxID=412755 RepID=A0A0F9V069_9ZZZZ